ncbi:MAG: DUF4390 domain-containing protein [Deferrisomatales bacterium]
MGLRRIAALSLTLLFVFLATPSSGRLARQPHIDGVNLRRGPHADLIVDFRVEGLRNRKILETLDSGLPVRFTYWVRVVRPRELRRDQIVAEVQIERVLEKDNLKNRFQVTLSEGADAEEVATLDAALQAMSQVEGVSVLPLDALGGRRPMVLMLKAQLQKFQLPFHLHYLFAFVSFWDVETEWHSLPLPDSPNALP